MDPGPHFAFGTHEQHGFVAAFTSSVPRHLAHWFLIREQFEPVPDQPDLFRLIEPEHDGWRRTRQAVHDLRRHGYVVHADVVLDPAAPANPPRPSRPRELTERRNRLAQAAASRSPQRSQVLTTPSATRPIPSKPAHTPTAHLTGPSEVGRRR
ncbi:hypothetical protein [Streptomyces calvus]